MQCASQKSGKRRPCPQNFAACHAQSNIISHWFIVTNQRVIEERKIRKITHLEQDVCLLNSNKTNAILSIVGSIMSTILAFRKFPHLLQHQIWCLDFSSIYFYKCGT